MGRLGPETSRRFRAGFESMLARQRMTHSDTTPSNGSPRRHKGAASAPAAPPPEPPAPAMESQDPLTGTLVHLGLSVHEAQMFRSLLEGGPSTARAAIEHSKLDRATGYRILSRL